MDRSFLPMRRHIDVDVSPIVEGTVSVEEAGERILSEIAKAASGKRTKSKILGHKKFSKDRIGPTL